jgi:putative holliday junction resolvase
VRDSLPGRIVALDVGRRRIGVAISDPLGYTAQGLDTLYRKNNREDFAYLRQLAEEREVTLFVLGLPLHMSGDESRQAGFVREFGDRLNRETGLPVEYWDERLTTVEAERILLSGGVSQDKRKLAIDKMAAVLLLENYLSAREAQS